MKTVKQLLRQPLKTVVGILLMTLAAAIVCLCVGQALAAQTTKADLDRRFSTVAIPIADEYATVSVKINEELLTWMEKVAREHPDIVRNLSRHGFLSAYIPELTPLNITSEQYPDQTGGNYALQPSPYNMPYTCAMLVFTLEQVGEPEVLTYSAPVGERLTRADFLSDEEYYEWLLDPENEKATVTAGYSRELVGTVTEVVSLPEGYPDPTGRTLRLTLSATTLSELLGFTPEVGQQYITYGMDYVDEYWKLIGQVNADGQYNHWSFWPYDPSLVRLITDREMDTFKAWAEKYPDDQFLASRLNWYAEYNGSVYLTKEQYKMLNAVSMSLGQAISQIEYEEVRDALTGALIELRSSDSVTYTDANGATVTVSQAAFNEQYRLPTIAKLEGSVEDFLQSNGGALWQTALDSAKINDQAFAVIGVDKLGYLADFAQEDCRIVAGRDFTEEELSGGARVCIVYEALAQANGLQVGDTVSLNMYGTDFGLPYQAQTENNSGLVNPSASFYFFDTEFVDCAEYTIVGICRGDAVFADVGENEYAFSANTLFVPKSSVQAAMEYRSSILFNTVVLQNGELETFHEMVLSAGFGGSFRYNDQNYSTVAANFHNYELLGRQILIIGAVVYAVLLLLFLLLFPATQKNNVRTMQSFGAGFMRRFCHVLASSMGIVVPAAVLGGMVGSQLWDEMVALLQTTTESAVALQIEPGALTQVAAMQLLFALVMNICVAVYVAAPRGMSARR